MDIDCGTKIIERCEDEMTEASVNIPTPSNLSHSSDNKDSQIRKVSASREVDITELIKTNRKKSFI